MSCMFCTRAGAYRLVRLAARYGPEMDLDKLLAILAGDCPYWNSSPRKYEPRCGARYVDLERNLPPADKPEEPKRQKPPKPTAAPPPRTLADWPHPNVVVACGVCDRRTVYEKAFLVGMSDGIEPTLSDLLSNLTRDCPKRKLS